MNYVHFENGEWREVAGNGVPEPILLKIGFRRLTKYSGDPLHENQKLFIEPNGDEFIEVPYTMTYRASINEISKDVSGVMLEFFEAKFPNIKTVTKQGNEYVTLYTLQESHRREWQKMVWDKWEQYMKDYIETKSTSDETMSATGVRMNDLLMTSFLGVGQWAIQPVTAGAPLTGQALDDFVVQLKTTLTAKYNAVKHVCIVTTVEQAECEAALYHTANFIMRNIIPGE